MTLKWLYRLEATKPGTGLWYDADGNLVWTIGEVPDCPTKYLPMGYDERYHKDGRDWHSSCSNVADLAHWYTPEAAAYLIDNHGFALAKYLATEFVEYEHETTFIKETSLVRVEISPFEVFKCLR